MKILFTALLLLISTIASADFNGCLLIAANKSQRISYSQPGVIPGFGPGCLVMEQDNNTLYSWNGSVYQTQSGSGLAIPGSVSTTQQIWVMKSGSDISSCGPFSIPCATLNYAQSLITDASSSKTYSLTIGPGTYSEIPSYALKDFVYLQGSGMNSTFIQHSDSSAINWSPSSNLDGRTQGINTMVIDNLTTQGLTVTRLSTDIQYAIAQLNMVNVSVGGSFTYTGLGLFQDTNGLTFEDIWNPINSIVNGTTTLHAVGSANQGIMQTLVGGTFNLDESGIITPVVATVSSTTSNTVTVPASSGFIASPSGGIGVIQKQNGMGKFTYTSYNNSTGVFSGVTFTGGSVTTGSVITDGGNLPIVMERSGSSAASYSINLTAPYNRLTLTSFNNQPASITINGTEPILKADATSFTQFPTLNSGALASQVNFQTIPDSVGVNLNSSGDWATPPTKLTDELKMLETAVKQFNGGTAIPNIGNPISVTVAASPIDFSTSYTSNFFSSPGSLVGVLSDSDQTNQLVQFSSTDTATAANHTSNVVLGSGSNTAAAATASVGNVYIAPGNVLTGSARAGSIEENPGNSDSGQAGNWSSGGGSTNTGIAGTASIQGGGISAGSNSAGAVSISGGSSSSTNTGEGGAVNVTGGSSAHSIGGNIVMTTGSGASRGALKIADGTEGVNGELWYETASDGSGHWSPFLTWNGSNSNMQIGNGATVSLPLAPNNSLYISEHGSDENAMIMHTEGSGGTVDSNFENYAGAGVDALFWGTASSQDVIEFANNVNYFYIRGGGNHHLLGFSSSSFTNSEPPDEHAVLTLDGFSTTGTQTNFLNAIDQDTSTNIFNVGLKGTTTISLASNTAMGLIVKGASSQSADLQEWQNSTGTVLSSINSSGTLIPNGTAAKLAQINASSVQNTNSILIGTSVSTNSGVTASVNIGVNAGANSTAGANTFIGASAGQFGTTGSSNTFIGVNSGNGGGSSNPLTSSANVGVGASSLFNIISTATRETAVGYQSLDGVTTGADNTGVGENSCMTVTTGTSNTCLGSGADVTSSSAINRTCLGKGCSAGKDNSLILGATGASAVEVGIGTASPSANLHIVAATSTTTGLLVQAAASQSNDLQEWENSTGTVLSKITSSGNITIPVQGSGVTPTCGASQNGELSLTSAYVLCVCNGTSWVHSSDGSTACTF